MSIVRHSAYNLLGATVPIVVLLVTIPIYLQLIGFEKYGILSIAWVLVGYFNFFDFGLGRAAAQGLARLSTSTDDQRSRLFWVALTVSAGLAVVATCIFYPLADLALGLVRVDHISTKQELIGALPLLVAAVPIGIMTSVLSGALEGRSAFLIVNAVSIFGSILTAALPLVAAWWIDPNLSTLIGATLVARCLVLVLLSFACGRIIPIRRPVYPDLATAGKLVRFGGWTTVSSIVGPILEVVDRFLIGALLSAAAVALYVLPMSLFNQLTMIPQSLARAIFPRIASADEQQAFTLSQEATQAVLFIVTPMALLLAVALDPFLRFWIGSEQGGRAYSIALVLILGFWANSHARVPFSRLVATGQPAVPAIVHAAEILPYLALLYVSVLWLGLAGAAFAWTARCCVDAAALHWRNGVGREVRKSLIIHSMLIALTCGTFLLWRDHSASAWATKVMIAAAAVAASLWDVPPALSRAFHEHVRQWRSRKVRAP